MIPMMIKSASHNAPRHLTTTAETDQLTRFCTFLRVARMKRRRQGPVCKHQRKRRTSIKKRKWEASPPSRGTPADSLARKETQGKEKKHKRPAAYLADLAQSEDHLYAKLGETTIK